MANLTLTVAQYLAAPKPFPQGTRVSIVDTGSALGQLTPDQVTALAGNGVTLINATDNFLSLSVQQFQALGNVGLSVDDNIELEDNADVLGDYFSRVDDLAFIVQKGVDIVDSISDPSLKITIPDNLHIENTTLQFYSDDTVEIELSTKNFPYSAEQIRVLANKNIDIITLLGGSTLEGFGTAQAVAFAQTEMIFNPDDRGGIISCNSSDVSQLSANYLTILGAKGVDKLDSTDNKLVLSFEQYQALGMIALVAGDQVTVTLGLNDLAVLRDSQIADMATKNVDELALSVSGKVLASFSPQSIAALSDRGVDIIDASDNALALTLSQYNALNGMKLTAADSVTLNATYEEIAGLSDAQIADLRTKGVDVLALKETGLVLGALAGDQLSALAAKGVNVVDALDDKLTLTAAQYASLNTIRLSAADAVTISSGASYTLSSEADHLTLTGAASRGTGNGLANKLAGNTKSNTLSGLAGNDTLWGGLGNDVLYGGTGKDVFVFDTRPSRSSNYDTIKDFSVADDTIWLDNAVFAKVGSGSLSSPRKMASKYFTTGTKATDAYDRIIYDKKTGYLSYDADGSGKGAAVVFAKLAAGLKLTYADFSII